MNNKGAALTILAVLVVADGMAWFQMFASAPAREASISFLDVGQGDSILLELAGGVKIMTDAGPDSSVMRALDGIMEDKSNYIDLAVITHPEMDHFNGFNHVIEAYRIGAFIVNGRDHPGSRQWAELLRKIRDRNLPLITLGAGDLLAYGGNRVEIISPNPQLSGSRELNDTGIVQRVLTPDFTALLAADIGANIESNLLSRYELAADILKVGHHGSKYSSGAAFLRAVRPAVAVISSGSRNSYGHPAKEALTRMGAARIPVFRTDRLGTLTVRRADGQLRIFAE